MPKSSHETRLDGYAPVAERIALFYEQYPTGRIATELVDRSDLEITFRALAYRDLADPHPAATGWASERQGDGEVNSVACLENTETSAIGRALANLGFLASTKRPSREEMAKADRARRQRVQIDPPRVREALQLHADIATDLLHVLATAERAGLPPARGAIIRDRLQQAPAPDPGRLKRLERHVRGWLSRRQPM